MPMMPGMDGAPSLRRGSPPASAWQLGENGRTELTDR